MAESLHELFKEKVEWKWKLVFYDLLCMNADTTTMQTLSKKDYCFLLNSVLLILQTVQQSR